jgi:radical SAM protein with 4Fe4S-binding SPASM domain
VAVLGQLFYDAYTRMETAEHTLLYLFLEVTRQCTLRCRHCGSDCGTEERSRPLPPQRWFSLVEEVSRRFSPELAFVVTGGEPLLWPHLLPLGRRIASLGRRWGMVTNGQGLDGERLCALEGAGLASITVSLDGDEACHNNLRNDPDAYRKTVRALRLVGSSSIPFRDVVTCVYPASLAVLPQVAQTLIECGIPHWRLLRIFPRGRAREEPGLLLDRKATGRLLGWIAENRGGYARRGLTVSYSCEGFLPFSLDRRVREQPFFCRSGVSIASILCDGAVTGCPNNPAEFEVGNVLRDDFTHLWETGFSRFRDRGWTRQGICAGCGHYRHCRGGSLHLWDAATGSPSFCFARLEARPNLR